MAFASIEQFPKKDRRLAQICKALSHPGRIAILRALMKKKSCICGDLVDDLPFAQSTVSQHLKVLKDAQIIHGEVDGPRSCYCLHPEIVDDLQKLWLPLIDNMSKAHSQWC